MEHLAEGEETDSADADQGHVEPLDVWNTVDGDYLDLSERETQQGDNEDPELEITPPPSHNLSFQSSPEVHHAPNAFPAVVDDDEDEEETAGNFLTAENVGEVVKKELLKALKGDGEYKTPLEESCKRITDIIAVKVNEVAVEDVKDDNEKNLGESWYAGENFYSCEPCVKYAHNDTVPAALKGERKGTFGFVSKKQFKNKMLRNVAKHERSDLHKWCVLEAERESRDRLDVREKNIKIGEKLVRNTIFCLKRGMSPRDFIALNEKDNIDEEISVATKNDSRKEFKKIRDYVKHEIDVKIKDVMKDVEKISITLDKVTVARHSYMVYLSFFFWKGKIHSFLNEIRKMNTQDYDAEGTAQMTIEVMTRTLGISELRFSQVIKHFSYDGVFADKEERVSGGGCLQLRKNMEEQLGKDEGDLKGDWEPAHKLEIIFHKVLVYNLAVEDNINLYSSVQKDYKIGKKASQFTDVASACCFLTLRNKILQKTRFVRSWLRVLTAGLVNTPTFVALFDIEMKEALFNNNNTEAKKLEKLIQKMTNARNLLLALGLCQILDAYSKCSVLVQSSNSFPVSTWQKIRVLQLTIDNMAAKWNWKDEDLEFAEVGNPASHVEKMRVGQYIPFVKKKWVRMNRKFLERGHDVTGFLAKDSDDSDNSEDEEEMAGSVPVEGFSEIVLGDVEKILSKLSQDLSNKMKTMLVQSNYQKEVTNTFGSIHSFALNDADITKALKLLEMLVNSFPPCDKKTFDVRVALPGFIDWDIFQAQERQRSGVVCIEDNWVIFVKRCHSVEKCEFRRLFEYCMIDVMSEALAETVGSVMTHHLGSGSRNTLLPVNLNCEIFIRFNLGPLHLVDNLVKTVVMRRVDDDQASYKRRLDGKRPDKLKGLGICSSSIHTFREEEKKKAHLPLDFWQ